MGKKKPLSDSLLKLSKTTNYNKWIYDNISRFIGQNILEIGCGIGNITDFLIKPKKKIIGIDIDKSYTKFACGKYKKHKNVKIVHGDFLKSKSVRNNSYDTVIMLNVLEHIKKDKTVINKIYKLLKKNGHLIILVPAMNFAYGELDKCLGHHKRYNKKDLKKLFSRSGFSLIKMFYMNFIGVFGWALNSRIFRRKSFPQRQTVIFDRVFVPVLKPIEKLIPPPIGQSLIAVVKK